MENTNFASRSPFKDLANSSYLGQRASFINLSTDKGFGRISSVINGSCDHLTQSRIDHLEKDRQELTEQLHQKTESERVLNRQLDQATSSHENLKKERDECRTQRDEAQLEVRRLGRKLDEQQDSVKEQMIELEQCKVKCSDLEEEVRRLNKRLVDKKVEFASKNSKAEHLWKKVTETANELRRVEGEAAKLRRERDDLSEENKECHQVLESLSEDLDCQKKRGDQLSAELLASTTEIESLQHSSEQHNKTHQTAKAVWSKEKAHLKSKIEELEAQLKLACEQQQPVNESVTDSAAATISHSSRVSKEYEAMIDSLNQKYTQSETERRKLHNLLQELRGNIRVFVRCRPFLRGDGTEFVHPFESADNTYGCVRCNIDGTSVSLAGAVRGAGQAFAFDQVFKPNSSQEDVYSQVSELVQSALDGYRVCIFSYGQTGNSGYCTWH